MTNEVESFIEALNSIREGVLKKLTGLTDEQARRVLVPSGTNLAGIIQHLTFVEAKWFEHTVAGRQLTRGHRSMVVNDATSLADLRAEYRAACASSNDILRKVGDLDTRVRVGTKEKTVREILFAVLDETARHCGHADIIREQIDERTGR